MKNFITNILASVLLDLLDRLENLHLNVRSFMQQGDTGMACCYCKCCC